ncbi:MAG: O-antigen ligase family protein [Alphaproteobacteria bacterium]
MKNKAGRVFAFVAWVLAPIAILATEGMVVLGILGAFRLFFVGDVRRRLKAELRSPLAGVLALAIAWAAVASIWSPNPLGALHLAARIALIFLGGFTFLGAVRTLEPEDRHRLLGVFCAAGVIYLGCLALELAESGVVTRIVHGRSLSEPFNYAFLNRGAVLLALFSWPFAHALSLRFGAKAAAIFTILVFLVLSRTIMAAAPLAFLAGCLVFAIVRFRPRPALRALAVALPLLIVFAPPALILTGAATAPSVLETVESLPKKSGSATHRVLIAEFALSKIAERPWFGWGFNAARAIPGGKNLVMSGGYAMPLHPHNAVLHIWLELGFIGALIGAGVAYAVLRRLVALAEVPTAAAFAAALLVSYCAVAEVSFGLWQNWWVVSIWLTSAFAAIPIAEEISRIQAGRPPQPGPAL